MIVKKTGDKFGIIINSNTKDENGRDYNNLINFESFYNRSPTKILMLTNILSHDLIDQESIEEIREECNNYGTVVVK